jgi:hypothetical protein
MSCEILIVFEDVLELLLMRCVGGMTTSEGGEEIGIFEDGL